MTVQPKRYEQKECGICGKTTKNCNFPCRDEETGTLGELETVCKDCHDVWSCCNCPRTRGLEFGDIQIEA